MLKVVSQTKAQNTQYYSIKTVEDLRRDMVTAIMNIRCFALDNPKEKTYTSNTIAPWVRKVGNGYEITPRIGVRPILGKGKCYSAESFDHLLHMLVELSDFVQSGSLDDELTATHATFTGKRVREEDLNDDEIPM